MFTYKDNQQVKSEFKKILINKGITMCQVASGLNMVPQQLHNKFNNSRLALSDLGEWLHSIGYELQIDFVPIENAPTDTNNADKCS